MDDFSKLIDFENLYASYKASMKGSSKRNAAIKFDVMALENICVLKRQISERRYKVSPYSEFIVTEPKQRIVKSGAFRDKVVQHCLCDYVLIPRLQDVFIRDNYAGQIGKGTLFGLDRLSENLVSFYSGHGCNGYILKCDITKFFYSINHEIMKRCVRQYFSDEGIQWICDLFIDSTEGDGLPLGNQCSQVFALMYLSEMDHFITEELQCKYYGRYMDDFYLISESKEYLQECLVKISAYLKDLRLTLNNKTEIVPIRKGIRFLGFHTYITENGVVIRKITGDNKRQIKKRLRKYAKLVANGKMSYEEFYERYNSWKNHALHGSCYKLTCSMDQYVKSLLDEVYQKEVERISKIIQ